MASPPVSPAGLSPRLLSRRQQAALPGSPHDQRMAVLKWLLPAAALVIGLTILIWPLVAAQEFSFLLAKDQVALAPERLRVDRAQYRGKTGAGEAFTISADSALQRSSAVPVVELKALSAKLDGKDGPASVTAPSGQYFLDEDRLEVAGPVALRSDGGYSLDAETVFIDLKRRTVKTDAAVSGRLPMGSFRADRMSGDLAGKRVSLIGGAHLRINQRGGT
ncbi:LPS export ABC transporter periplasmic protein LptC [Sandarakinorhabdus rubra]|uniref:LPS export ABC transporter periplasmic protein LptC n=1 Tax=Sandarakinorhabdus rubra TaxID=2672568 RepID=UPI0013DAD1D4|nr:LPS export ABC transporter periplasmic protein LptC [Sandarakinorhabdus rubra]